MTLKEIAEIKESEPFDIKQTNPSIEILAEEILQGVEYSFRKIKYSMYNMQMSNIWTKIIELTGRFVLKYASDIFIPRDQMTKEFETGEIETLNYLFAMRSQGVDGFEMFRPTIANNAEHQASDCSYYNSILLLSINKDESKPDTIKLTLAKLK